MGIDLLETGQNERRRVAYVLRKPYKFASLRMDTKITHIPFCQKNGSILFLKTLRLCVLCAR